MTELRACPMCGDTEPDYAGHGQRHSVKCALASCQTDGPWMLTKAAAAAAWNRRADDWMPIETAPRDGTRVVLWGASESVLAYWYGDSLGWQLVHTGAWAEDADVGIDPTHWRPLPEGPR